MPVQFTPFSKECSALWKTMTDEEKRKFQKLAEEDRERYKREVSGFDKPLAKDGTRRGRRKKEPGQPKRNMYVSWDSNTCMYVWDYTYSLAAYFSYYCQPAHLYWHVCESWIVVAALQAEFSSDMSLVIWGWCSDCFILWFHNPPGFISSTWWGEK